jgi:hypothetical protein
VKEVLRGIVPYLWGLVIVTVLYAVWVVASRHSQNREIERALARKAARVGKPFDDSGTGLRILHFYPGKGEVAPGEALLICYGVRDAKAVRIDPPVEQIRPMWNRCLTVMPTRTTTYRLRAEGFDGDIVSASFTVEVRGAGQGQGEALK